MGMTGIACILKSAAACAWGKMSEYPALFLQIGTECGMIKKT